MADEKIKKLKKSKASIKTKLTQFEAYLNTATSYSTLSDVHCTELECRLARIENVINEFDILQTELESLSDPPDEQYADRLQFENQYFRLVSSARTLLAASTDKMAAERRRSGSVSSSNDAKSGLLPDEWHGVVELALDGCYGNRTRHYTNACPGQGLLHCTVEKLIENCPDAYLRKADACSPVSSLAGFKYMFSQGTYENLEANLPYEQRPPWFMKHYFSSKCCHLPELFNATVLSECGFTQMMHYLMHSPVRVTLPAVNQGTKTTESIKSGNSLRIVDLSSVTQIDDSTEDPLDCCDMSGFIQPSWRTECDFQLTWDPQNRLTIKPPTVTTTPVPTTTTTSKPRLDVKVLPLSCPEETCVFRKLNVITESGTFDIHAFSRMLDNLTADYPAWASAKARAVTKCLTRPITNYEADCEINKVLACTFDVLSENCPTATRSDPCKHSSTVPNDIICQISSAKGFPKNRHQFCDIPRLIRHDTVLRECGVTAISRMEYSTHVVPVVKHHEPVSMCKKLTDSTTCLLSKMGALNKYNFMDYFKMKDNIREFVRTHTEWLAMNDAYLSVFSNMPMYKEYCSSPKKLLNLIDSMLMTCPSSVRKSSPKCYKILNEISHSSLINQNTPKEQLNQLLNQFQDIFLQTTQKSVLRGKVTNKMYDFGILNTGNVPPVKIIDVKPTARPIKVLLPVYQQMQGSYTPLTIHGRYNDGLLRSGMTGMRLP